MKNKIVQLLEIYFLALFTICIQSGCSDTEKDEVKVYLYREQVGKKIKELTDLQTNSIFGIKKGNYPESSRSILQEVVDNLKDFLQLIQSEQIPVNEIPKQTEQAIHEADVKIEEFKLTVLTEDLQVPAELYVDGKNGGYIDFGSHPEYSNFSSGFTVDLWFKFEEIGSFDFILSTFVDTDNDNPRLRQGWAVNYFGEGGMSLLRMTYALGVLDLYEPGVTFGEEQKWVHIAMVWDPKKIVENGDYGTFRMYLNGNLVKEEKLWRNDYNPNVQNVSMIGFNRTLFDGTIATDGKGANGYMKHLHIWNTAKSEAEVLKIMNEPETINGSEKDLVCGWPFTQVAEDDSNIVDLTGKYTAKLVGKYGWVEKK